MVALKTVEGYRNRIVVALGDSRTADNHNIPLTGLQSLARGSLAQARALGMGRFIFRPEHNFGVSGDTSDGALHRTGASSLDALVALRPDRCLFCMDTNAINASVAKEQILADQINIFNIINSNGIALDYAFIAPRTNGMTSTKRNVTQWLKQEIIKERNNRQQSFFRLVPTDERLIDRASSTGDPINGALRDGLHNASYGAVLEGQAIAQHYAEIYPDIPLLGCLSQASLYHATENRHGAINSNPLMTGNTGTKDAATSGEVATNYAVNRVAGSALTMSCSKTLLADQNGGARQDISIGGTGGIAHETFILNAGSTILIPAGLSPGQILVVEADVETIGMNAAFKGVHLTCVSSISGEANDLRSATSAGERDIPNARRLLQTRIPITSPGVETFSMHLLGAGDCSGSGPAGTIGVRSMRAYCES